MRPLCRPAIARWFDLDADHAHRAMAAALCERCPLRDACREQGRIVGGSGTWAGEFIPKEAA
jgi:hypothetical protein